MRTFCFKTSCKSCLTIHPGRLIAVGITKPQENIEAWKQCEDLIKNNSEHNNAMAERIARAKAKKTLVEAAENIPKISSQPADPTIEDNNVPIQNSNSNDEDLRTKSDYFVILDHTALEPILGPIFTHLCRAMKDIKEAKVGRMWRKKKRRRRRRKKRP